MAMNYYLFSLKSVVLYFFSVVVAVAYIQVQKITELLSGKIIS